MSGVAASIRAAQGSALERGALESTWGLPEGRKGDIALAHMLTYAETGDWKDLVATRNANLIARNKSNIPSIQRALARRSVAHALSGEAAMRVYTAVTNFETALINKTRLAPSTYSAASRLVGKATNLIAGHSHTRATVLGIPASHVSSSIAPIAPSEASSIEAVERVLFARHHTTAPSNAPAAAPGMPTAGPNAALGATFEAVGAKIVNAINILSTAVLTHHIPGVPADSAHLYAPAPPMPHTHDGVGATARRHRVRVYRLTTWGIANEKDRLMTQQQRERIRWHTRERQRRVALELDRYRDAPRCTRCEMVISARPSDEPCHVAACPLAASRSPSLIPAPMPASETVEAPYCG
jgi:hypothetical protein